MIDPKSVRRMIENEVIFRHANEKVQKFVSETPDRKYKDSKLHFYCECANEDCRERIIMAPAIYKNLHENRKWFIIKSGHGVNAIERVVKDRADYSVVEKYQKPPENAAKLQDTPLKT